MKKRQAVFAMQKLPDQVNEKPAGSRGPGGLGRTGGNACVTSDACEDAVERLAGAEGGVGLGVVREVIAADVDGVALDG